MYVHVTIKVDEEAVSAIVAAITGLAGRATRADDKTVAQNAQPAITAVPTVSQTVPVAQPAVPVTPQPAPEVPRPIQQAATQATAVPTTTRAYTAEELRQAAMTLMDKGMQAQLQSLLAGYGVEALPMLPPEQYGNFATALRGLGAQI